MKEKLMQTEYDEDYEPDYDPPSQLVTCLSCGDTIDVYDVMDIIVHHQERHGEGAEDDG